jgi:hypothetical protein
MTRGFYLHSILRLSRYCQCSVVLACRQKYSMEPMLCFAICFPPYRFNRLRVDAKGHLSAPVKPSEHLLLFQVP